MKTIPHDLQTHLESSTVTLTYCWKVTRQDGVIKGFTSHTSDLVVGGVTYQAATGYKASAVSQSEGLNVDDLDVIGILGSLGLSEADLLAGLYDHAEILVFLANYVNPAMGTVILRRGWIGQVIKGDATFTAELRSLIDALQGGAVGKIATPTCQADLGDTYCQVVLASYTHNGAVTAVTSRREFTVSGLSQTDNYYQFGLLTWTSGANDGLQMEVKEWTLSSGKLKLMLPMPYDAAIADTFDVTAGCNKTRDQCYARFSNVVNMKFAFPDLPGLKGLLQHA